MSKLILPPDGAFEDRVWIEDLSHETRAYAEVEAFIIDEMPAAAHGSAGQQLRIGGDERACPDVERWCRGRARRRGSSAGLPRTKRRA